MKVTTYQHAYIPGTSTLCTGHAQNPPESLPSLGPVSHGQHEGMCEVCAAADPTLALEEWWEHLEDVALAQGATPQEARRISETEMRSVDTNDPSAVRAWVRNVLAELRGAA